jgi:hypothetical protein
MLGMSEGADVADLGDESDRRRGVDAAQTP